MRNKILTLIFAVFVLTIIFVGPINKQVKESFSSSLVYGYGGGGSYKPAVENVASSFKNIGDTITKNLAESGGIRFKLGGESHTIKVKNIYTNSVRYEISSTTFYVIINGGETKKVDVNNNNFYDVAITLKGLTTTKAKTTFEILLDTEPVTTATVAPAEQPAAEAPACEENWKCSSWSECINGKRTRVCEDQNNCGTTAYKPVEELRCRAEEGAVPLTGEAVAVPERILGTTWIIIGIMIVLAIAIVVVLWLQRLRLRS